MTDHLRTGPTDEVEDHDRGLAFDLGNLLARRRALVLLGGAGLGLALGACGSGSSGEAATSTSTTTGRSSTTGGSPPDGAPGATSGTSDPDAIPEETAGPYPGDGSNGPDILLESGVVRSDITRSFGSASGVAEGVPLTLTLTVTDTDGAPRSGYAVYAWHCTRDGGYSMYSEGIENENFLRGVQETASDGTVTFTTIFPACYSGRWPHVHFEVYESLATATASGAITATSQLAFPEDVCAEVYATEGYEASISNLANTSLASDMVFSDSYDTQMATMSGSVSSGYTASLDVPVA